MTNSAEQNGQQVHKQSFSTEWEEKWKTLFHFLGDEKLQKLKKKILELSDDFDLVYNSFGKLDKALQICEFLVTLKYQQPPQDTDKIIITTLVSCAESVRRINCPQESSGRRLVKDFFEPVESKLKYKILSHKEGCMPYKKTFDAADTLYLIRNDYIHNGNFLGRFFKNSDSCVSIISHFDYAEVADKSKLIAAEAACNLIYAEFKQIFLEAFIANIEQFTGN